MTNSPSLGPRPQDRDLFGDAITETGAKQTRKPRGQRESPGHDWPLTAVTLPLFDLPSVATLPPFPTPSRKTTTRAGTLFEPALHISIPSSLDELFAKHGLQGHLNLGALQYVEGQVEFLTHFFNTSKNLLAESATGSGKAFVALMAAAQTLAMGKKVLFLTPMQHLANQLDRDSRVVLALTPDEKCILSGDIRADRRKRVYDDEKIKLIIATPEVILNDYKAGNLNFRNVGLVIFDEAHRAIGDYVYVPLGRACQEAGVRRLGFSALMAPNESERWLKMERLGLDNYFPLSIKEIPKWIKSEAVYLDDKLTSTASYLTRTIHEVARELYSALKNVSGSTDLLRDLVVMCLEHGKFRIPSAGAFKDFNNKINAFISSDLSSAQKNALSLCRELGHLRHLHMCLTTMGQFAFLDFAGRNLAKARFGNGGKKAAWYLTRMYSTSPARAWPLEIFKSLACGTPYEKLLEVDSLGNREAFFKEAKDFLVKRKESDHPIELATQQLLLGDSRATGGGKVIVFVKQADQAEFRAARIRQHSGIEAVTISGKKHMSRAVLNQHLEQFASGTAQVLVMTSAGQEGLDIKKASLLIIESPPSDPLAIEQLSGRPGRKEDLEKDGIAGGVVFFYTKGTEDEMRYYAGTAKWRKARRIREESK